MSDTPQLLLAHHLKALRLPSFLREYDKLAQQCAAEGVDHPRYLLRLAELELIDREQRMVERRIKEARFPTVKSLDSFEFVAIPSLNKTMVLELARCEYVARRENVIAVGNSGTGKTHIALGLGLAACQKGLSVGFVTAAALVHELIEARDEKRLLRLQRQLAGYKLLIIDELGYVPLSTTGAELLFEVFSQRYERGSTIVTSNLPFDEWTGVFGSERLTGALLDRLTHHVHILEMNELFADLLAHRGADADFAGSRKRFDPRRNVDAVAEHVAFVDHDVAEVDADAEANALAIREVGVSVLHPPLHNDGAAHGIDDRGELDQHAVAGGLEDAAAVLIDQRIDQFTPMTFENGERLLLVRPHQPRIFDDIGAEDR